MHLLFSRLQLTSKTEKTEKLTGKLLSFNISENFRWHQLHRFCIILVKASLSLIKFHRTYQVDSFNEAQALLEKWDNMLK